MVVGKTIRQARDWRARARGLLGRTSLEAGEGLWLLPCRQVHTWFMRMSIDVLFLDRELMVLGVCRNLGPYRLSPLFWRARSVLELGAGQAQGVQNGHRLSLKERGDCH